MTDSALKPCPFCGGAGHMARDPDMNWGNFYFIKCGMCRAKSPEFHASETCPVFFAQVRDAWSRRADLAPDPLADPRVWELVEAVEDGIKAGLLPKTSASEGDAAMYSAQVRAADRLRAALAALSPTGGNADG